MEATISQGRVFAPLPGTAGGGEKAELTHLHTISIHQTKGHREEVPMRPVDHIHHEGTAPACPSANLPWDEVRMSATWPSDHGHLEASSFNSSHLALVFTFCGDVSLVMVTTCHLSTSGPY
jgi:hypothetical protein